MRLGNRHSISSELPPWSISAGWLRARDAGQRNVICVACPVVIPDLGKNEVPALARLSERHDVRNFNSANSPSLAAEPAALHKIMRQRRGKAGAQSGQQRLFRN